MNAVFAYGSMVFILDGMCFFTVRGERAHTKSKTRAGV